MKKTVIILAIAFFSYSTATVAEEWSTPEALRAFGKPGDTVNPDLRKKRSATETAPKKERRSKKVRAEKTISASETGRPYKSDTLEKLFEREENCKSSLIDAENNLHEYKKEILRTEAEIEKGKVYLEHPEQYKAHVREQVLQGIRDNISFHKKILSQHKELVAITATHIQNMEIIRANNMKEIELRKR